MVDYDMETAKAMLETRRYLYVGFMCHQVIEKSLKGFLAGGNPDGAIPYIHNLTRLADLCGFYPQLDDSGKDTLDILDPLNIEARYPTSKDNLAKSLSRERCEEILQRTERLAKWIRLKSIPSSSNT